MSAKRKVEVFTAGCPVCEPAVTMVKQIACPSCQVEVIDTREEAGARKAAEYGLKSLPAVVIDGKPADCCAGRGPDEATLRAAGLGVPLG